MDARAPRLRFGDFELDPAAATLLRDGRRIRIQPQPLRVLTILVERAGEVVSRDELRHAVWDQATFVEFDQGLNYCIRQIRSALGDDASAPTFIDTLKKRGYQFIAPVERVVPDRPAGVAPVLPESARPAGTSAVENRYRLLRPAMVVTAVALVVALAAGIWALVLRRPAAMTYTQLTSFGEAAFAPALSPDGRQAAFIVGSDVSFPTTGEIYTKQLPDGEPIQRTHDGSLKYGVSFSPDGSRITYTVADAARGWITEVIPALGGEPRLLLSNAAGLTWLDDHHVLFAEIKSGLHMGLVEATANRSDVRDIYLPAHERAMAHYGYASPDRASVLVVEMGPTGAFARCRVVPFDGRSPGRPVGPSGACTSAAWSPDGRWMYFTAYVNGASHIWRQRFPNGEPEQITSGPSDEQGVAMAPDGRTIVAAVGMTETGVWLHGPGGDTPISPDGYASQLSFSRDGRELYYVLRRVQSASRELWVTDLASNRSAPLVPGQAIVTYDVSSDGTQVIYSTRTEGGRSQLFLASRDGHVAPRLLPVDGDQPAFGPDRDILFRHSDGARNYLFDVKLDGATPVKAVPDPIIQLNGVSPDRQWAIAMVPVKELPGTAVVAVSLRDGMVRRICPANCMARWSPAGDRFYIEPLLQGPERAGMLAIPVAAGESVPVLPPAGVQATSDSAILRGSVVIDISRYDPTRFGDAIAPGPAPNTFAFARTTSHRNLFRLQLP